MTWSEYIALAALASSILVPAAKDVISRLMRGSYATRDWVEAKMRPINDKLEIDGARIRDIEAEHRLLKAHMSHMPTTDHIDELRNDVAGLKSGQAVTQARLDNLKEGQDRIERTLGDLAEDIRRNR